MNYTNNSFKIVFSERFLVFFSTNGVEKALHGKEGNFKVSLNLKNKIAPNSKELRNMRESLY